MQLLITAPHSKHSGPIEAHMADWIAGDVAISLYHNTDNSSLFLAHVDRALVMDPRVYMQDVYRRLIDLNRPESRGTRWREILEEAFPHADLLLDIHSFPPGEQEQFDYGLFEIPGVTNEVLLRHFTEELRRQGYRVQRMSGSYENDIVVAAQRAGVDALLVEVNEDMNSRNAADALACAIENTSRSMLGEPNDWGDEALIAVRWVE